MSKYTYSDDVQRFRSANGRFVPASEVRADVDNFIRNQQQAVKPLVEQLVARKITLSDFQLEMEHTIKDVHLANSALAKGGWSRMKQADYGRVGQIVRREYGYLATFMQQLESGAQPLTGRVLQRSTAYVENSRSTYETVQRLGMKEAGYDIERNIEDEGVIQHCEECSELSDMGWVPIGTHPAPGHRICLSGCQCRLTYGKSGEGEEAA